MATDNHTPQAHGYASCDDCGHRWVAVWPLGADALECPKCHSTNTDREAETNVDRGLNRQARNPAAPASNGPMVENPQGFQEGAPRSRGAHGKVGTPDQHHSRDADSMISAFNHPETRATHFYRDVRAKRAAFAPCHCGLTLGDCTCKSQPLAKEDQRG